MDSRDGLILHLTPQPKKPSRIWQVTPILKGVTGKTAYARRIKLAAMQIELTPDGNSYWLKGACAYYYESPTATIFIKLKKDLNEADKAGLATVQSCPQT